MKPRYQHDCKHCVLLGKHGKYDLYCCMKIQAHRIFHWEPDTGAALSIRNRRGGQATVLTHGQFTKEQLLGTYSCWSAYRAALRLASAAGMVPKDEADELIGSK